MHRRICPHCNHARRADETAPDWQCPACERAYDKSASSPPPGSQVLSGAVVRREREGGLAKWLVVLIVFAAAFWFARSGTQSPLPDGPVASGEQPAVVLYATDWCGYCKATREFFAANGIRYTEYDIEKSSAALKEHRQLGGQGVPLIVVGDDVIKGYNEAALRQLLAPWIRS